jgi:nicotinate-nucleotide pyrophosphorylase (carboxylating)
MINPHDILAQIEPSVRHALEEDIGDGDITTHSTVPPTMMLTGRLRAKADGVIAGLAVARLTFRLLEERVEFTPHLADGQTVTAGQVIATLNGPGRALLSGERVALNFLQRMSGIATLTRRFVEAARPAIILDTRKTAPGLRAADKWAVALGGAENHRFGLYDMALIKENHIAAVGGSLTQAVARVRAAAIPERGSRPIEVEVKNLAELEEALTLNVDRIMLDNMNLDEMRAAVKLTAGRVPLEASGNVTLETVASIAATGVDYISSGALTHSAPALDISLLLENFNSETHINEGNDP